MLESGWLFVGALAVVATAAAVLTNDDGVAIMAGVVGFVTWGVWTFGTLNVTTAGCCDTTTRTMPELAILGVAWALIPGYIALTGPVEIVSRTRSTRDEDV